MRADNLALQRLETIANAKATANRAYIENIELRTRLDASGQPVSFGYQNAQVTLTARRSFVAYYPTMSSTVGISVSAHILSTDLLAVLFSFEPSAAALSLLTPANFRLLVNGTERARLEKGYEKLQYGAQTVNMAWRFQPTQSEVGKWLSIHLPASTQLAGAHGVLEVR